MPCSPQVIFNVEILLKIGALGFWLYIKDFYNKARPSARLVVVRALRVHSLCLSALTGLRRSSTSL